MHCCVSLGEGSDAASVAGKSLEAVVITTGERGCTTMGSRVTHRCTALVVQPFGIRKVGGGSAGGLVRVGAQVRPEVIKVMGRELKKAIAESCSDIDLICSRITVRRIVSISKPHGVSMTYQ